VSIDNLTACNYLSGSQDSGNEIWWNGGADTATIGLHGYEGSYLTAETTYFGGESTAAEYGIFSSDSAGDGASWSNIYASNFNDSGMYVGACQQVCDVTISKAWMEYNALGYSGTNSGGRSSSRTRCSTTTRTASTPTPRSTATPGSAERRLPGQRHLAHHPHPLVLGGHGQHLRGQQQPERT